MNRIRIASGILFWLVVGLCAARWMGGPVMSSTARPSLRPSSTPRTNVAAALWQFTFARRPLVTLELDEPVEVALGDPIFVVRDSGQLEQVGEIRAIDAPNDRTAKRAVVTGAQALLYPAAPMLETDAQLTYHAAPQSMEWVVATLLPPEKRRKIAHEMASAYESHRAEVFLAMQPVVMAGLEEAMGVVRKDLPRAIARHRDELEQLGNRYQAQVVEKEIIPLVKQEIWPIVREHAEPLATEMGIEMWQRASVWRFGWRYLYDKSPLPEQDLIRREWDRFVEKEALDVLQRHADDLIAVQQEILTATAKNQAVRTAVRRHLRQIIDDEEFRAVVWKIIQQVLIDNPRLHAAMEAHWKSEATRDALRLVARRVEPHVRRIGELLIGSREEGITPEFARVLRNQILDKDRRAFVLTSTGTPDHTGASSSNVLRVQCGGDPTIRPFPIPPRRGTP